VQPSEQRGSAQAGADQEQIRRRSEESTLVGLTFPAGVTITVTVNLWTLARQI
jgi:hypothetical protein